MSDNNTKRACVRYKERTDGDKPKTHTCHNFFSGKDATEIKKQFWANPTWSPETTRSIEIVAVEWID